MGIWILCQSLFFFSLHCVSQPTTTQHTTHTQGKGKRASSRKDKKRGREGEEEPGPDALAPAAEQEAEEEGPQEQEEEEGFTPLHTAAYGDDLAAATALVEEEGGQEAGKGAVLRRLEALDAKGRTPAQVCACVVCGCAWGLVVPCPCAYHFDQP